MVAWGQWAKRGGRGFVARWCVGQFGELNHEKSERHENEDGEARPGRFRLVGGWDGRRGARTGR